MPVISVNSEELLNLTESDEVTLLEVLPKLGIEVEAIEEDKWDLEIDPDRCDLLSIEGIGRAVRGFLEKEVGLPEYELTTSDINTEVELSVQEVRPYIVTALVKNVELTEPILQSLMDLQEKLHLTLGRDRSKVAIGLHDFDPIEPPFTYKAVKPKDVSFVPLEKSIEMDLEQILERHEKGKEYAHILEENERYPLIVDSNDEVLSFPPVINGQLTEVDETTETIFIDMTGTDMQVLEQTLNIFCTSLAERGADIHSTKVNYGNRSLVYPDFSPETMEFPVEEAKKLLGVELDSEEVEHILKKMRYSVEKPEDTLEVKIPSYRHDIMHPWDIIEDVAIGYDYDNFDGCLPEQVTIGKSLESSDLKDSLIELLIGYGFHEVMNYMMTNPEQEYENMELKSSEKELAKVENPVSENNVSIRSWLLPSLLENLRENRTEPLPHKFFEIGDIVESADQETKVAGVIASSDAGFTDMKSMLDGLLTNLGLEMSVDTKKHGTFIKGRCAGIRVDGTEIGYFGEVHPKVLENFEIENPVIGFELEFEKIKELKSSE